MKQKIISYLHGHYDELFELNKYLYTILNRVIKNLNPMII